MIEKNSTTETQMRFVGSGGELLGIYISSLILTILTLGLYYPWAKAKIMRYVYSNTELDGDRFSFHGTGNEMFRGFLIGLVVRAIFFGPFIYVLLSGDGDLLPIAYLSIFAFILFVMPYAVHGALRYRLSRTSYRGIHLAYKGDLGKMYGLYIGQGLLSLITFGIYSNWMIVNIRRYIFSNIQFGNLRLVYSGSGGELFGKNIVGAILMPFTLYLYLFKWRSNIFNFHVDNTRIEQEDRVIILQGQATGLKYFTLMAGNMLLTMFTFGLGAPYAMVRNICFTYDNIVAHGDLRLDELMQSEQVAVSAAGEEMSDLMDLDIL